MVELEDLVALRPPPRARVPAPAPRLQRRDLRRRGRRRPPDRPRQPRVVADRPADARRAPRGRDRGRGASARSSPAARSRPASSPSRSSTSSSPRSSRSSSTPRRCCRTRPNRVRSTCASRSRTTRRLSGTVPDVHGTLLRSVTYSRVNPRHRLDDLGALPRADRRAPRPRVRGGDRRPRGLRRAPRGATVTVVRLPRMDPSVALEHLAALVELFDEGLREPLPIACKSSAAYAEALRDGSDPVKAATSEWDGPWNFAGEGEDLEHQLAFGGILRLRRAARDAPRSTPTRAGCGTTCSRGSRSSTDDRVLRRLRPAADRRDRARGERGHRQDVHDRRARRPLRRRGHPARADPDGDVHAHGHRRAARARARAAGQRRAGARARAGGRAAGGRRGRGAARHRRADRWSRLRRERLAAALADFDSATIATTHGFCQEVLGGLGVLGDIEADTTFVEDISDLRDEVVDDLYLRRFHRRGVPEFSRAQAMAIASAAIDNPAAPIEPADAPDDTIEAMRVRLAGAARDELEARKRRMGVMTYDDLLTRLSDTLDGRGRRGRRGAPARPLPRRARRRVPGHRPRAVADHADRVRRRRDDARADRRPEAGDLRVPRRRRLRLHRGRPDRRLGGHADDELAQRPGPDRRLRRALRRREARARGDRLPRGPRRERATRACTARRTRRRCGSASSRATRSA